MWGGLSIGYTYHRLRAEPSKAGETGSRSVWMKKKYIFLEYIYNALNRCESHPVVTTDRQQKAQSLDRQVSEWAPGPDRQMWMDLCQTDGWSPDRVGE